ncbi:MAG: 30S ribosomal protein S28e [Candidatus Diapherotrites archaeon]|nr:30S ribosomal protein S28e [Candidatus Diapherotrites archaeon]
MSEEKGTLAEVVEIVKRTGVHGEVIQILCKILEGPEKGRIKRRNVKGNPKKGDLIVLLDTEREAKEIKATR